MPDVHIVGGGPSGLFAGIAALRSGKSALVSEEHWKVGEPEACSGLISKSGLEALRALSGVDYSRARINGINSARIVCGTEEFGISPREETAVLVSRQEFDSLAAEKFEQEGGELELGKKVTREFEADCVIGADGPASLVASRFGFPKIRSYVASMQGDFAYECEDAHCATLFLSSRDFPGFFGWVIPKNESEAKIGAGVSLPRHHPIAYYRRFLARLGVSGKPSHEFAAVIPTTVRAKTAMRIGKQNVLLAGDAAGQVKATTGGGVFFGASCGMLAGRNAGEPEKYEREWRAQYGLDLALHRHLRTALDLAGGQPPPVLVSAAKALFFEELLSERGKMDRWGQMASPSTLATYAGILRKKLTGN
ncbi:MAG: NAD(P)/FAD-dependent oxidoreductase [Candidatus Micrarchaeota archaeon]|nr:NAD(P)/FAD-dependent oxidoreductase [Candidatus Micrarchaeota archaeon]